MYEVHPISMAADVYRIAVEVASCSQSLEHEKAIANDETIEFILVFLWLGHSLQLYIVSCALDTEWFMGSPRRSQVPSSVCGARVKLALSLTLPIPPPSLGYVALSLFLRDLVRLYRPLHLRSPLTSAPSFFS